MKTTNICPGHLAEWLDGYCPACRRHLFGGKKVSLQLGFDYDVGSMNLSDGINQLSVSGVQEKLSGIVADG